MNVLADESIDFSIVDCLRQAAHHVVYAAELSASVSDDEILRQANSQGMLLLTADKDFGELVFRQRRVHHGVVLARLFGLSAAAKAAIVAELFADRSDELPGSFTVVTPGMVRIRGRI